MANFELGSLAINTTRSFLDSVGSTNLEDTYRFSISGASTTSPINLHTSLTGISPIGDPYQTADLYLYQDSNNNHSIDASDSLVGVSSMSLQRDESLELRSPESGAYIVKVSYQTSSSGNHSTPYALRLSNTGSSPRGNLLPVEVNAGTLGTLSTPFVYSGHLIDRSAFVYTFEDNTVDTIAFTVGTAGNFNASLTGLTADADMRLIKDVNSNGIVDSGDERIASTRGGSWDEAINILSLATGNYFLQTYLFSNSVSTPYTLRMSNTAWYPSNLLPTEVNAGTLTTTPFVYSGSVSSTYATTDNATDVFRFTMGTSGNFNASLTGLTSDVYLRLIRDVNNNGVVDTQDELVRSVRESHADQFINIRSLTAGSYLLQPYLIRSGSATPYTLRMSNTGYEPSNLLPIEFNAGTLTITPIVYSDSVGSTDAADTFRFRMATAGIFHALLTGLVPGSGNDVNIRLIGDVNNNGVVDSGDELIRSQNFNTNDTINFSLGNL